MLYQHHSSTAAFIAQQIVQSTDTSASILLPLCFTDSPATWFISRVSITLVLHLNAASILWLCIFALRPIFRSQLPSGRYIFISISSSTGPFSCRWATEWFSSFFISQSPPRSHCINCSSFAFAVAFSIYRELLRFGSNSLGYFHLLIHLLTLFKSHYNYMFSAIGFEGSVHECRLSEK